MIHKFKTFWKHVINMTNFALSVNKLMRYSNGNNFSSGTGRDDEFKKLAVISNPIQSI